MSRQPAQDQLQDLLPLLEGSSQIAPRERITKLRSVLIEFVRRKRPEWHHDELENVAMEGYKRLVIMARNGNIKVSVRKAAYWAVLDAIKMYTPKVRLLSMDALQSDDVDLHSKTAETYEIEDAAILRMLLDGAIDQLKEKEKTIVRLFYYKHMKIKDIAKTLGEDTDSVSRTHKRALGRLKTILNERYGVTEEIIL